MERDAFIPQQYVVIRTVFFVGILLILALPLLNIPPWFSPPDWGKTILFRILLSLLLFCLWLFLLFGSVNQRILLRIQGVPLLWRLLILTFLILFVVTVFSRDVYFSVWGDPVRAGGFINLAGYLLLSIFTFLVIREHQWKHLWRVTIGVGVCVALIAIAQQFGYGKHIFVLFENRPPSTLGSPIFLGIYLLILTFIGAGLLPSLKHFGGKLFVISALILFVFVTVFLAQTRAAFLGLGAGAFWFLFFYPKRLVVLKLFGVGVILLIGGGLLFLKAHPELYRNQPQIIQSTINRMVGIVSGLELGESRISAWKVSLEAFKSRILVGYGPENFSIGFDQFYVPSLPGIERSVGAYSYLYSSWWDRAHNILLDIGMQAGVFAVAAYLALFGALLWTLQKVKRKLSEKAVIAHGLQAGLIGYFVANLFSFDTFSTYLIFFLIVGYTMHLSSSTEEKSQIPSTNDQTKESNRPTIQHSNNKLYIFLRRNRLPVMVLSSLLVTWFLWQYNIRPFQVNTNINRAEYVAQHDQCPRAIELMEYTLTQGSTFLDAYLRMQYADLLKKECVNAFPDQKKELANRGYELMREATTLRPTYTRNWMLLGGFTNVLLQLEKDPQKREQLTTEANSYFEKAHELSPKRQEVYLEWVKTDLFAGTYEKAKEKAQQCINLNEKLGDCWWLLARAEFSLGNLNEGDIAGEKANQRGYNTSSQAALVQLTSAYETAGANERLVELYRRLIEMAPTNYQYHASLAATYRDLGEFQKAREEALKVLELEPATKETVEEFLQTLP